MAEYQPTDEQHDDSATQTRELNLQAELEKNRRALSRLMHLFLYAEDEMPQADFLREKKHLQDTIARLQSELEKAQRSSVFASSLTDEEFLGKAARLLFQSAMVRGGIDFPELAMRVGNLELKNFVNAVIKQIIVLDGRVTQITFANDEIHTFLYR